MLQRSRFPAGLLPIFALVAIVASMTCSQYRNSIQRTQEATLKTNLFRLRDAIDQYKKDKTHYPPSLQDLVDKGYLRKVPEDPMTKSASTWKIVWADRVPASGVMDVKSGAPGVALDGTTYANW